MNKIEFVGKLEQVGNIDATSVNFPYNVEELFGTKGQVKVKTIIDGVEYRGSLANMGTGCHILGITKEIRKKINKKAGDFVTIILEKDTEERIIEIPNDFNELLKENPDLSKFFESLSFTNRKEYIRWIESAKKEETRKNRLDQCIEKLINHKKNPSEK
jgi:bifunctional DNA-binding transcriptional regulator/antitoxin component of YhaV-PrlF toxin-antitoxin module